MGSILYPETSVNNYHTMRRNIPQERRSHKHPGGSLKSRLVHFSFIGIQQNFRFGHKSSAGIQIIMESIWHYDGRKTRKVVELRECNSRLASFSKDSTVRLIKSMNIGTTGQVASMLLIRNVEKSEKTAYDLGVGGTTI
jgi:hypothetical protein